MTRRLAITTILTLIPVLDALPAEAHQRYRSRSSRSVSPARSGRPAAKARKAPKPKPPQQYPTPENLARLRQCESGGDYGANTGNGYFGAYQWSLRTWRGMGYEGMPHHASPEVQDEATVALVLRSGWRSQFPACSRKLGLR